MQNLSISKLLLVLLFVSAFGVIKVGAEVIVADLTEDDLSGDMRWSEFLENCNEGGAPYSSGGYFDTIQVHLEADTDKGTVAGTLNGGGSDHDYPWAYTQDYSFDGTIVGEVKRVFWAGYLWEWQIEADVELDLCFSTAYRCKYDSTGEYYWVNRTEAVHVTKLFTAQTFSDTNSLVSFYINWKHSNEQFETPVRFYMTHKNEDEQGRAILPMELPDPIDIGVSLSGPETIGKGDSEAKFSLQRSGNDLILVQSVNWYFYYYDDAWVDYVWFESFETDPFNDLTIDESKIGEWLEYLDDYGKTVNGVKTLPMQVYVECEAGEFEWLAISEDYNFTLTSAQSSRFNLDDIEVIEVYPTAINATLFELDHSGTELTSQVSFMIEGNIPEYLSVKLDKTTEPKSSNGKIENVVNVELDTSKLNGVTLPIEHNIVLKAKSTTIEGTVEDSQPIILQVKPVKWLLLHYVASDTSPSLQAGDEKNIQEIMSAFGEKVTPKIAYTLLIDLEKDWNNPPELKDLNKLTKMKTHLLNYNNFQLELVESSDTLDMSKGSTLKTFLENAKKKTPAEKTILILTDHGQGLDGMIIDRHFGLNPDTMMSITSLDSALDGNHFDLLVLEACWMGTIEVLYELGDKADYIISSQISMSSSSFAYKEALSPLLRDLSINPSDLGRSFITTYVDLRAHTISLIETSKLETLVQSVNELSTSIQAGFQDSSTREQLFLLLRDCNNDLKNIVDNILRNNNFKDQKIREAALKVQQGVTDAVIEHVYWYAGERVVFTENQKRGLIPTGEESVEEPYDSSNDLNSYDYHGICVFKSTNRLSSDFKAQYETFSFSEKTNWYDTISAYSNTFKSKIEIRKQQKGNNLYLRIVDSGGYVNGFDPDSTSKSRVVLDYVQSEYYRYLNGTEVIYLPVGADAFTTYIWGGDMEESEESYTITYRLIIDDLVVAEQILENPITEYTEHSMPITILEDEITIGETTITQLQVPSAEPDIENNEQESESSGSGIPGFQVTSVMLGVSILLLINRARRESLS